MSLSNYTIWDEFKVHMGLRSGKVNLNPRVMVSVNCICFMIKFKLIFSLVPDSLTANDRPQTATCLDIQLVRMFIG